jgi:hypothetical protein
LPLDKEPNEIILYSQKKKKHGRGCTCQLNLSGLAGSTEFLIVFILL